MAYATRAQMETALSEAALRLIADHDNDGTADVAVLDSALDKAASLMDTYLSQYLPLATVPSACVECNIALANYFLRVKDQQTDDSKDAFKHWMDWLKSIAKGEATLDVGGADEEEIDAGDPEIVGEERVWTRTTAGGLF